MTTPAQALAAAIRGIAGDALLRSAMECIRAITALTIAAHPLPLTHRRGRGVSRAAKHRRRRATSRALFGGRLHMRSATAWSAVAEVAGAVRIDDAKEAA